MLLLLHSQDLPSLYIFYTVQDPLKSYQPLATKNCKELQVKMLRDSKKAGWDVVWRTCEWPKA